MLAVKGIMEKCYIKASIVIFLLMSSKCILPAQISLLSFRSHTQLYTDVFTWVFYMPFELTIVLAVSTDPLGFLL